MSNRFSLPREAVYDSNGDPMSGAKLFFYQTGTTTAKNTYSNPTLTTANANPVVADAEGRFGDIFLDPAITYKVELKTAANVTVWTADPVSTALDAIISDDADTGQVDPPNTGGTYVNPSESGRTTNHLFAVIASQNCRSYGPARAVNIGSIHSAARGNVSGNFAARLSLAYAPQSVNIATEEGEVYGFRGANLASIYSQVEYLMGANIACRLGAVSGEEAANIASDNCTAGKGRGARLAVTTSGGQVTAVTVIDGGSDYDPAASIVFFDRENGSASGAVATPNISGGVITSVSVTSAGSGYSDNVDAVVGMTGPDAVSNVVNIGSTSCKAEAQSAVNLGSNTSAATGIRAVNLGATASTASGQQSANLAASGCSASGELSANIGANNCTASATDAVVIGGRFVENNVTRSVAGGNGSSPVSTANRKWHIYDDGDIDIAGTLTSSHNFSDYAEFFENVSAGVIPLGTIVALEGRKVRPARAGDRILGVVSGTAGVVLGDTPFCWQGRYLTGEFGEPLWEEVVDPDTGETVRMRKENPDWDRTLPQIPRSQRPREWTCVGLIGQVHVRVGAGVAAGDFVAADGAGSASEARLQCMEIRQAYDKAKGYAVALCLLR